jgi:hypothetical protein
MPTEVVPSEPTDTRRRSAVAPDAGGGDDLPAVVDAGWKDGDGRIYGATPSADHYNVLRARGSLDFRAPPPEKCSIVIRLAFPGLWTSAVPTAWRDPKAAFAQITTQWWISRPSSCSGSALPICGH